MAKITTTDYTRKLDSAGRMVIPSKLRDTLGLCTGDELEFYLVEEDGRTYLAVECPKMESEIERAKRVLREAGIQI